MNFPLICRNIQLIRYFRACGLYHVFLDRRLLLTEKLLNQEFLVVRMMSSIRKSYGCHHDLVNLYGISASPMNTDMFLLSYLQSGGLQIHDLL